MAKFTDRTGHEWNLVLSVDSVGHVKRETGVDLNHALTKDAEGKTTYTRLADDLEKFVDVIYAACETQIKELGLTTRQFAALFDGDAIESAGLALMEAICDFFPKRTRDLLHKSRQKVLERMRTPQVTDAQLDAIIDAAFSQVLPAASPAA